MDYEAEKKFIKKFVHKNFQERVSAEWNDPKKREKGLYKIASIPQGYLKREKIALTAKTKREECALLSEVRAFPDKKAYMIVDFPEWDGRYLEKETAVKNALDWDGPSILVFESGALLTLETGFGTADKYLLKE